MQTTKIVTVILHHSVWMTIDRDRLAVACLALSEFNVIPICATINWNSIFFQFYFYLSLEIAFTRQHMTIQFKFQLEIIPAHCQTYHRCIIQRHHFRRRSIRNMTIRAVHIVRWVWMKKQINSIAWHFLWFNPFLNLIYSESSDDVTGNIVAHIDTDTSSEC